MDDAMKELGCRAIAAGWRWMLGCADHLGRRVVTRDRHHGFPFAWDIDKPGLTVELGLPDFSDPATVGCLLAQVRGRWGDEWLYVSGSHSHDGVVWRMRGGKPHGASFRRTADQFHPTEAAALVAALEAAPKVAP